MYRGVPYDISGLWNHSKHDGRKLWANSVFGTIKEAKLLGPQDGIEFVVQYPCCGKVWTVTRAYYWFFSLGACTRQPSRRKYDPEHCIGKRVEIRYVPMLDGWGDYELEDFEAYWFELVLVRPISWILLFDLIPLLCFAIGPLWDQMRSEDMTLLYRLVGIVAGILSQDYFSSFSQLAMLPRRVP